jgi:hypothetical protein
MPITAFSGVRNSWLICARKTDLASCAARAADRPCAMVRFSTLFDSIAVSA